MISFSTSVSDSFFKTKAGIHQRTSNHSSRFFKTVFSILNKKERMRFSLLIAADIVISVIDILSLALLLWIVQFYIQPGNNTVLPLSPRWIANKNSISFIALFFFLFAAKNLTAFFISRAQFSFIGKVAVRISKNNLIQYQQSSFEEFVNVDSSIHLRKIAYQPYDFCLYILSGIQQVITQSSLIVITIIAVLLFNAKLFLLLLLILLPPVFAVFYFIKRRLTKAKWHIKKGNEKSFQYLMDALKGYVEGNVYDRNDFFLRRFVAQRKNFSYYLFDSMSVQALPSRLIEIFAVMGLFILIVIAQWTGSGGQDSMIILGAFMAAAYKIIPGAVKIVNVLSQIKAYEFSLKELAGNEVETTDQRIAVKKVQSLRFENIYFQYKDTDVLSNISFDVCGGDFVGIAGKSGKGKTTLFNLLLGFLPPSEGSIFINDSIVTKEQLKNYWPSISYVRQQPFFIHDTILKNITLEEENHDEKRLECAVRFSGLDEFIRNADKGINMIITENGKNISGGQQQRIALARALYKDANLILLDEPFNELDEASETFLLNHFRQLASAGKLVVMITHNKEALSFCNKIISLDDQ